MKSYQEYKEQVTAQLKGHYRSLFLILFVFQFLLPFSKELLVLVFDSESLLYTMLSLCLSLLFSLMNYVVLFLFVQRVREEAFTKEHIRYGCSRFPVLLVTGLLISLIQVLISAAASVFAIVLPLYYIVISILNIFFILWNAMIAYAVYDGVSGIGNLFMESFHMLWNHMQVLLRGSALYIIWFVLSQLALSIVVYSFLGNTTSDHLVDLMVMASNSKQAIISIAGIALLHDIVQLYLLVPLYMLCANVYEEARMK